MPSSVETLSAPAQRRRTRRTTKPESVTVTPPPVSASPVLATQQPVFSGPSLLAGPEPTRQQIRERAYLLFLGRNGVPGDPVADWLTAEKQLRTELVAGNGAH